MTYIKFTVSADLDALREAIEDELANAFPSAIEGVGANGDSAYDVSDVSVADSGDGTFTVTALCERTEGLFASRDDLADAALEELGDDMPVDITLTITIERQ